MGIRLKRVYEPLQVEAHRTAIDAEVERVADVISEVLDAPQDTLRAAALIVAAATVERPSPVGVEVQGVNSDSQNFSERLVRQGVADGWLTLSKGKLIIHNAAGEDVSYDVVEGPGVFCSHCGKELDGGNETAQAHVAGEHGDTESPDPQNPAGYRVTQHYATILSEGQDVPRVEEVTSG